MIRSHVARAAPVRRSAILRRQIAEGIVHESGGLPAYRLAHALTEAIIHISRSGRYRCAIQACRHLPVFPIVGEAPSHAAFLKNIAVLSQLHDAIWFGTVVEYQLRVVGVSVGSSRCHHPPRSALGSRRRFPARQSAGSGDRRCLGAFHEPPDGCKNP